MTTKGTDNRFRSLTVVGESGTPSTPASGDFKLYVADDGTFYLMDDTGTTAPVGGGGFSDPMTTRGDIIVRNASNVTARLAKGSADTFLHSDGTDVGYAAVTDAMLSTSDITTNDSSTSKHGFLKKLDNNSAHFMDGTGAWSTPATGAAAVPTAIQAVHAGNNVQNLSVTITAAASGNRLVLCVGLTDRAVSSVSCTNVTWTNITAAGSGTSAHSEIWVGVVSGGSSGTTVTVNTGSSNWISADVYEITDALTPTRGAHAENNGTAATDATPVTSSIASTAGRLVVGVMDARAGLSGIARFLGGNGQEVYATATAFPSTSALTYASGRQMCLYATPGITSGANYEIIIAEVT